VIRRFFLLFFVVVVVGEELTCQEREREGEINREGKNMFWIHHHQGV
jgi:hypothetical protein